MLKYEAVRVLEINSCEAVDHVCDFPVGILTSYKDHAWFRTWLQQAWDLKWEEMKYT
jgi:hypothetical protein